MMLTPSESVSVLSRNCAEKADPANSDNTGGSSPPGWKYLKFSSDESHTKSPKPDRFGGCFCFTYLLRVA